MVESLVIGTVVVLIVIVICRVKIVTEGVLLPKVFLLVPLSLGNELMMVLKLVHREF